MVEQWILTLSSQSVLETRCDGGYGLCICCWRRASRGLRRMLNPEIEDLLDRPGAVRLTGKRKWT